MTREELKPGQKVLWFMEPRGGYCQGWWVPAMVVKVGPKRITILAEMNPHRDGTPREPKKVFVMAERLKPQTAA